MKHKKLAVLLPSLGLNCWGKLNGWSPQEMEFFKKNVIAKEKPYGTHHVWRRDDNFLDFQTRPRRCRIKQLFPFLQRWKRRKGKSFLQSKRNLDLPHGAHTFLAWSAKRRIQNHRLLATFCFMWSPRQRKTWDPPPVHKWKIRGPGAHLGRHFDAAGINPAFSSYEQGQSTNLV